VLLTHGSRSRKAARVLAAELMGSRYVRTGLCVHVGCGDGLLTTYLSRGGRFVVQGLSDDPKAVERARRRAREDGLTGRVSVAFCALKTLPYAPNSVNVLVADDTPGLFRRGLRLEEIGRVLCPGGAAWLGLGSLSEQALLKKLPKDRGPGLSPVARREGWVCLAKAWPEDMDEWPQDRHDAARTAVSTDQLVGPPTAARWVAGQAWLPEGAAVDGVRFVVSGGRAFFFIGQELRGETEPGGWLIARDAFTGVKLWQRRVRAELPLHLRSYRLAADRNHLYAYVDGTCYLAALDAATGQTRVSYGVRRAAFTLVDGIIVAGPGASEAWDAATGERIWKSGATGLNPCLVSDASIFVLTPGRTTQLRCLELLTGAGRWSAPAQCDRLLCCIDDVIVAVKSDGRGRPTIYGYSTEDGRELWQRRHAQPLRGAPVDVVVVGGQVWLHGGNPSQPGKGEFWQALDLKTGRPRKTVRYAAKLPPPCYGSCATPRYILCGGMDFFDFKQGKHFAFHGGRGTCAFGFLPAAGMVMRGPSVFAGFSQVGGFAAFAADGGRTSARRGPRLTRGPAYGGPRARVAGTGGEWPTFRHDAARSGATTARVGRRLGQLWRADLGPSCTAPVAAGGMVLAAVEDRHQVVALDAADGEELWRFAAGGRVDSPPTLSGGRVLFGSADGDLYCLDAAQGELVWRLRLAPGDRQIVVREQVQSAWPVHGSVLVMDGIVYASAGLHSELDGGVWVSAVRPTTGQIVWEEQVRRPDPLRQVGLSAVGNVAGHVLSGDGEVLYMDSKQFDAEKGDERRRAPGSVLWGGPLGYVEDIARPPYGGLHERRHWVYVTRPNASRATKLVPGVRGSVLAVSGDTVFGIVTGRREVFAHENGNDLWRVVAPEGHRLKAVLAAADVVFVAGAAEAKGKNPGRLWAYSATDGSELTTRNLPAAPRFDGMAATPGRLYVATADGAILCFAGR